MNSSLITGQIIMACYTVCASPPVFDHSLPPWLEDFLSLISAPRSAEDVIAWKGRTLTLLKEMKSKPAELAVFEEWHFLPNKAIRTICGPLDMESLMEHKILIPITVEQKGKSVSCCVCPYVPRHQERCETSKYRSTILLVAECSLADMVANLLTWCCYLDDESQRHLHFVDHYFIMRHGQALLQLSDLQVWDTWWKHRTPATIIEVCLEHFVEVKGHTFFAHMADSIDMVLRATKSTESAFLPYCEFWPKDTKDEPIIALNEFLENPEIIDLDYDRVYGEQFWKEFHSYYQKGLKFDECMGKINEQVREERKLEVAARKARKNAKEEAKEQQNNQ